MEINRCWSGMNWTGADEFGFCQKRYEYQVLFEEDIIAVPQIHPLNEKAVYVEGSRYRNPVQLAGRRNLILQNPNQSIRADVDAA